jgi:hypothetical protein
MREAAILGQGNFCSTADICGTNDPEIHGAHLLCSTTLVIQPEETPAAIASAASRPFWLEVRIELQEIVIEFAF